MSVRRCIMRYLPHQFIACLLAIVLCVGCQSDQQPKPLESGPQIAVGMLLSDGVAAIYGSGGTLTQMGWPGGAVYCLKPSGTLIALVFDSPRSPVVIREIRVDEHPPTVVTEWKSVRTYRWIQKTK